MSQDVSRNSQLTTSKKKPDQAQCLLAKSFRFTTLRARNIASIHLVKFLCAIPKVIHVIGSMPQQAIVSPKSPGRTGAAQQQYAAQHQRQRCHRCPWKGARHENTTQPASKVHTFSGQSWKETGSIATVTFVSARSSFSLKICLLRKKRKKKQIKNLTFEKKAKKNEKDKKAKENALRKSDFSQKALLLLFVCFFSIAFFLNNPKRLTYHWLRIDLQTKVHESRRSLIDKAEGDWRRDAAGVGFWTQRSQGLVFGEFWNWNVIAVFGPCYRGKVYLSRAAMLYKTIYIYKYIYIYI